MRRRALGAAGLVASSGLLALALGCGASDAGVDGGASEAAIGDAGPSARPACPATLRAAADQPCPAEGVVCPIGFQCGATYELVHCTCTASHWSCADPRGPVEAGAEPRCAERATPPETPCPSSVADAQGTPCDEIGRACYYEGAHCAGNRTMLDDCACARDEDSGVLAYACVQPPCAPTIESDP